VPVLNYHLAYEGHSLAETSTENTKQDWNVVVNNGVTDEQIAALCKIAGCKAVGHPSKGGVPFFVVSATEDELEKLMRQAKGAAKYAEPDSIVSAVPEIEADGEASTWGLNRIGADLRDRTGSSATIFVLDTGVRNSHTDFGGRAAPGADVTSGTLVDCNGNAGCAADVQGHGTHCAGTAAGTVYGVAPSAQVRSVKVLSDQGSGAWDWSYQALDWLATSSVRPAVASMSLGGNGVVAGMRDAVDAAVSAGVTVVVAAGNSNADACGFSPAYVPNAVTVGSTDSRDSRSYFSCYGTCVDIWAPGSSVVSASHLSDSGTATLSGTSMACPHVSGAAALVLGADNSKNPQKVISDLLSDATRNVISDLKAGDTNALLYVGAGGAPPTPPTQAPAPTPAPTGPCYSFCSAAYCQYAQYCGGCPYCSGPSPTPAPTTTPAPAPTPSTGNCSSWCEPPADCTDYPFSCSGCCDGSPSPSPPAPSPPSGGDCYSICDRCSDLTNYPNICGGCTDLC